MSIEKARLHLEQFECAGHICEHETSCATVELAAQALGTDPARIAKTLSFLDGENALLVVTAGDARVSSSLFKKQFGLKKARMIPPEDVEQKTGHAPGGVCPFGVNEKAVIWLDVSLKRFATVFPACGSPNSSIELSPNELERYSGARGWVDICTGWK